MMALLEGEWRSGNAEAISERGLLKIQQHAGRQRVSTDDTAVLNCVVKKTQS